ncbi:MAG: OmpA family protein [Bryobacteraceae bacterium]
MFPGTALPQDLEPDEDGCKDSQLVTRMPGCRISACEVKDFDSAELVIGVKNDENVTKPLEGKVEILEYECPEKVSPLQIIRNVETALRKVGYKAVYSGNSENDKPAYTVQNGGQWIGVTTWINSNVYYKQVAVTVQKMEQTIQATAKDWAAEINKSGRVAVYGIQFEFAKADIKPESEGVLSEIVTLLRDQPDWKLQVQGHTDNVGSKAVNQALSEKRAQAVVAWLVAHGVDKARLAPKGLGDSQPVADNSTEDGRAKNRRVDLVKM